MPIFSSIEPQVTALRAPTPPFAAGRNFGTMKSDSPRGHQMHDVFREIVLAGGDENLGAGDLVAAVALRRGAGAHQAEIGAALRLGEIHRAGPFAGCQLPPAEVFLLWR